MKEDGKGFILFTTGTFEQSLAIMLDFLSFVLFKMSPLFYKNNLLIVGLRLLGFFFSSRNMGELTSQGQDCKQAHSSIKSKM